MLHHLLANYNICCKSIVFSTCLMTSNQLQPLGGDGPGWTSWPQHPIFIWIQSLVVLWPKMFNLCCLSLMTMMSHHDCKMVNYSTMIDVFTRAVSRLNNFNHISFLSYLKINRLSSAFFLFTLFYI